MNFKISQEAILDLENIWLYTFENWSLEQADKYFNLILDKIERLAENPKLGDDYSQIRKGYFRSNVKLVVLCRISRSYFCSRQHKKYDYSHSYMSVF
jgi:plasmid stabilization system protein ParE